MRRTLGRKVVTLIVIIAAVISAAALISSNRVITAMVDKHFKDHTWEMSQTAAVGLDPAAVRKVREEVMEVYRNTEPKIGSEYWGSRAFEEYLSHFAWIEDTPEFQIVQKHLREIQDLNNVESIYVIYADPETMKAIYLVDAAYEDACRPGCFDPVYEFNRESVFHPEIGFQPYITDTPEYGWLVTAGAPIYDGQEVLAFCATDISMETIREKQVYYTVVCAIILLLLTIGTAAVGIVFVERAMVRPIKILSSAAQRYSASEAAASMNEFAALDIHTGDEIQELAESMKRMEQDVRDYYQSVLAAKQELLSTREEAENMQRLANLDGLTGIRNKRAFNTEAKRLNDSIREGNAEFGLAMVDMNYLKRTNDVYGHEKGDIAILQLCNIICGIFVHSPVFRVGGDEFVVILVRREYEQRDKLVEEFTQTIDKLSKDKTLDPWERLSAAIGYAIYDPEKDRSVEDVLERADGIMYVRKKEMKEKAGQPG